VGLDSPGSAPVPVPSSTRATCKPSTGFVAKCPFFFQSGLLSSCPRSLRASACEQVALASEKPTPFPEAVRVSRSSSRVPRAKSLSRIEDPVFLVCSIIMRTMRLCVQSFFKCRPLLKLTCLMGLPLRPFWTSGLHRMHVDPGLPMFCLPVTSANPSLREQAAASI
jgi:hypothetical protein